MDNLFSIIIEAEKLLHKIICRMEEIEDQADDNWEALPPGTAAEYDTLSDAYKAIAKTQVAIVVMSEDIKILNSEFVG